MLNQLSFISRSPLLKKQGSGGLFDMPGRQGFDRNNPKPLE